MRIIFWFLTINFYLSAASFVYVWLDLMVRKPFEFFGALVSFLILSVPVAVFFFLGRYFHNRLRNNTVEPLLDYLMFWQYTSLSDAPGRAIPHFAAAAVLVFVTFLGLSQGAAAGYLVMPGVLGLKFILSGIGAFFD